jgi:hypothetical protein
LHLTRKNTRVRKTRIFEGDATRFPKMRIFAGDAFLNKRFRLYIGTDAVLEHPPKSALLLVSQDLAWVGHLTTSPMAVSQLTKKRRRQRGEQKFIGDACFPRFDRASTPEPPISPSS